jgi:hypothetical protein
MLQKSSNCTHITGKIISTEMRLKTSELRLIDTNQYYWVGISTEPKFVNVSGAHESIQRNRFRQPISWRAGTSNRVVVPARRARNQFLGFLKGLQIRTLALAKYEMCQQLSIKTCL